MKKKNEKKEKEKRDICGNRDKLENEKIDNRKKKREDNK